MNQRAEDRFATFTPIFDTKFEAIDARWTKALSRMEAHLTWRLLALLLSWAR